MADQGTAAAPSPHSGGDGDIPLMQRILDNHFLLLFLGIIIPSVVYILWGLVEILAIPVAP